MSPGVEKYSSFEFSAETERNLKMMELERQYNTLKALTEQVGTFQTFVHELTSDKFDEQTTMLNLAAMCSEVAHAVTDRLPGLIVPEVEFQEYEVENMETKINEVETQF